MVIDHTIHLDHRCLVIGFPVVQHGINPCHTLSHILLGHFFLHIVHSWTNMLLLRAIYLPVVFSTSQTLHRSCSKPLGFNSCTLSELIPIKNSVFVLIPILGRCSKLHISLFPPLLSNQP